MKVCQHLGFLHSAWKRQPFQVGCTKWQVIILHFQLISQIKHWEYSPQVGPIVSGIQNFSQTNGAFCLTITHVEIVLTFKNSKVGLSGEILLFPAMSSHLKTMEGERKLDFWDKKPRRRPLCEVHLEADQGWKNVISSVLPVQACHHVNTVAFSLPWNHV